MRRIVVFNRVSADGYFSEVDGGLQWMTPDAELDKAAMEGPNEFDTFVFGRKTYELFASFWPKALENPRTRAPHGEGEELSSDQRSMAVGLTETTKLVFSRTLKEATWKNTRLVSELDPKAIAAMKAQPGKNMLVLGSGSIASQLTEHGLIDEYQIVVAPTLLGGGQPMIRDVASATSLRLIEARPFKSGNVLLRYGRGE